MTSSDRELVRSSAGVALGTLLSRVTGLMRVWALAYALGGSVLADTYNVANNTPNIVFELILGGVLTATLVPLFVDAFERDDDEAASAIFGTAMVLLVVLTLISIAAAPSIAHLFTFRRAHGADRVRRATGRDRPHPALHPPDRLLRVDRAPRARCSTPVGASSPRPTRRCSTTSS